MLSVERKGTISVPDRCLPPLGGKYDLKPKINNANLTPNEIKILHPFFIAIKWK